MKTPRWKLSPLELLEFALAGVNSDIRHNTGNGFMTHEDWSQLIRAQREIERRIKILQTNQKEK